jgi:hypothetical protein
MRFLKGDFIFLAIFILICGLAKVHAAEPAHDMHGASAMDHIRR